MKRALLLLAIFLGCATAAPATTTSTSSPAPVTTSRSSPDGGPFDFTQAQREEKKNFSSGDVEHAGKVPGYTGLSPYVGPPASH
jgi:hypothetical protein